MKTELVPMTDSQVLQAFGSEVKITGLLSQVDDIIDGFSYDLTTRKGRSKISSLSSQISSLKVAVDKVGKARCKERV